MFRKSQYVQVRDDPAERTQIREALLRMMKEQHEREQKEKEARDAENH